MKILIVQNGWSGQGISGGDKHLLDVSSIWRSQVNVSLLVPLSGFDFLKINLAQLIEDLNIVVCPELFHSDRLKNILSLAWAYAQRTVGSCFKVFLLEKYDVVLSSSHFFYDVLPAIFVKFGKGSKNAVYIYHLVSYQERGLSLRNFLSILWEKMDLFLIKIAFDLVLIDNVLERERLIELGFSSQKLFLTSNSVFYPEDINHGDKKFDLCFTGRITKRKGVYDLIKIVEALKVSFPTIFLAIVGIGDEQESLKKLVAEKGLTRNVSFLGFLDEEQKYETLKSSKIFVSPSIEEGWGISLAEAMACFLPAVVYDLPVYLEVFGNGPVRVPTNDWKAMSDVVNQLLTDAHYYQEKSSQSRLCVRRYSLETVASTELQAIKKLCV